MINEELMKAPVITLTVPSGEKVENFIENHFGTLPATQSDMPSDIDIEETVIIKLK